MTNTMWDVASESPGTYAGGVTGCFVLYLLTLGMIVKFLRKDLDKDSE